MEISRSALLYLMKSLGLFIYHATVAPHRRLGLMRAALLRMNRRPGLGETRLVHCTEVHITT